MKKTLAVSLWVIAVSLWGLTLAGVPISNYIWQIAGYQTCNLESEICNPYRDLYEEMLAPVVKITSKAGTGSGVVIANTPLGAGLHCRFADYTESTEAGKQVYILTAAHVVGDENEVQVTFYSYRRDAEFAEIFKATVVITDTIKDLALLRGLCDSVATAKLAPRSYKPYLFTEVWAVGCSLGFNPRPSEGIVSAVSVAEWEISAPILPGNSGGGVFLKDTHELIGIAVWVRVYHGQLVTTMAGVVTLQDIYSFLDRFATEAQSTPRRKINNFLISETSVSPWLIYNLSVVSRRGFGTDLTCWSSRGSDGAIGTRGPAGQPNLRKEVRTMALLVSHVQLMVPFETMPVERIITKWTQRLKDEAPAIFQKIQSRLPTSQKFQEILAQTSAKAYASVINPAFVSRAGTARDKIVANQASNLMRSFDKYMKKLTHAFETVDTVEAKRFKEAIDLMKDEFAKGVANRTLPFTGTKIEGRGAATIAPLWLVDDPMAQGLLRPGDKLLIGGPKLITKLESVPALKAALQGRLIQAGANIVKDNFNPAAFTQENDRTNDVVGGFIDPSLNIAAFSTGGDSHVDYILGPGDRLYLEVKVAVTP